METASPGSAGFLGSLRSLADGLLAALQDRVELISIELQEEKLHLIRTFIWISAAVFSGMMATVFASLTLVYLFWESARIAVLGGLAAFFACAVVAIIITLRRFMARQPGLFSATRQELGKDRECIRNEN
jgi:uncharacterized membrane protein YqjE